MPGIPTQFLLLERANDLFEIDDNNLSYGYLGAVGASLGDFIENGDAGSPVPDPSPYWKIWNEVFARLFGYEAANPQNDAGPSLLASLTILRDVLEKLKDASRSRDTNKLPSSDELSKFMQAITDLQAFLGLASQTSFTGKIGDLIFASVNMKPNTAQKPPVTEDLILRDLLHWRRTGHFLRVLLEEAHGDGEKGYARGYLSSYAGKVCGSPFINSIAGGPYRTTWWRNRWIANWVDAWVYGAYSEGITMSGDTPSLAYADWKSNLADADLHLKLSKSLGAGNPFAALTPQDAMNMVRGKQNLVMLPQGFCKFWFDSFADAYAGDEILPAWIADLGDDRKQVILTHAFLRLWLVLWFQTGTGVPGLGAEAATPEPLPSNCTNDKPVWEDPSSPLYVSAPPSNPPPIPQPETEDDTDSTLSEILAAIFTGGYYYLGQAALGAGAIILAIASGGDDPTTTLNWDQLACALYWYEWYYWGFCDVLHKALVKAGFAFPRANELDETLFKPDGTVASLGTDRIKSRAVRDNYPLRQPPDMLTMAAWQVPPTTGVEPPITIGYLDTAYPTFFIDDPAHRIGPAGGLSDTPGVLDASTPLKTDGTIAARTGNAMDNIKDLWLNKDRFKGAENNFPSWNLDADRGLYYWTWEFEDLYDTTKIKSSDES